MSAPRVVLRGTAPFRVPVDPAPTLVAELRQVGRQVMVAAAAVLVVALAALLVIGWAVGAGPWPAVVVVEVVAAGSAVAAVKFRLRDRRPS